MLWSRFFRPISNHDHGKQDQLMIPTIKVLLIQEDRLSGMFVFQILTLSFVIISGMIYLPCVILSLILWFNTVISATASDNRKRSVSRLQLPTTSFSDLQGITWPTWSHGMGPVMLITWSDNRRTNQLAFLAAPVWRECSLNKNQNNLSLRLWRF